jgi:CRP-like cAMP-binding protein
MQSKVSSRKINPTLGNIKRGKGQGSKRRLSQTWGAPLQSKVTANITKDEAATRVQKLFRGHFVRKGLATKRRSWMSTICLPIDQCIPVIMPQSRFRITWDTVGMLFLIYNIMVVPYRVAWDRNATLRSGWFLVESVIDWFFVLDICINFRTAVVCKGGSLDETHVLSLEAHVMAQQYLKKWFWVDLSSSVPIDFFVTIMDSDSHSNTKGIKLVRILRLAKFLKLLKVLKIQGLSEQLQDHFNMNDKYKKVMLMLIEVIYLTHIIACGWFWVSRGEGEHGWYARWSSDNNNRGSPMFSPHEVVVQYVWCLYWAMTTISTVGFGDISPATMNEALFTILAMGVGVAFFGYLLGNVSEIVATDSVSARIQERMQSINGYMRSRNIPSALKGRIRNYFRYMLMRKSVFDEKSILEELSLSLRFELTQFLNQDMIQRVPLLHDLDEACVNMVVENLNPVFFDQGAVIFSEGEAGREMFLICSGSIELSVQVKTETTVETLEGATNELVTQRKVRRLLAGEYFGETELLPSHDFSRDQERIKRRSLIPTEDSKGEQKGERKKTARRGSIMLASSILLSGSAARVASSRLKHGSSFTEQKHGSVKLSPKRKTSERPHGLSFTDPPVQRRTVFSSPGNRERSRKGREPSPGSSGSVSSSSSSSSNSNSSISSSNSSSSNSSSSSSSSNSIIGGGGEGSSGGGDGLKLHGAYEETKALTPLDHVHTAQHVPKKQVRIASAQKANISPDQGAKKMAARRLCNAHAYTVCDLYSLAKRSLDTIFAEFPEFLHALEKEAPYRRRAIERVRARAKMLKGASDFASTPAINFGGAQNKREETETRILNDDHGGGSDDSGSGSGSRLADIGDSRGTSGIKPSWSFALINTNLVTKARVVKRQMRRPSGSTGWKPRPKSKTVQLSNGGRDRNGSAIYSPNMSNNVNQWGIGSMESLTAMKHLTSSNLTAPQRQAAQGAEHSPDTNTRGIDEDSKIDEDEPLSPMAPSEVRVDENEPLSPSSLIDSAMWGALDEQTLTQSEHHATPSETRESCSSSPCVAVKTVQHLQFDEMAAGCALLAQIFELMRSAPDDSLRQQLRQRAHEIQAKLQGASSSASSGGCEASEQSKERELVEVVEKEAEEKTEHEAGDGAQPTLEAGREEQQQQEQPLTPSMLAVSAPDL